MGNSCKNTERNRNGWISRFQDGCELVSPKKGAGLYCLSNSFSLLLYFFCTSLCYLYLVLLASVLPLSFIFSYLWCVFGPRWFLCSQLSMCTGTYNWPRISLSISYSNSWDEKTLVGTDHSFETGPIDHESGQPMAHSPPIDLGKWKKASLKNCLKSGG